MQEIILNQIELLDEDYKRNPDAYRSRRKEFDRVNDLRMKSEKLRWDLEKIKKSRNRNYLVNSERSNFTFLKLSSDFFNGPFKVCDMDD